jgi:hypothetical protein
MSYRGKPGNLVTYAKGGGRIALGDRIPSRREVRQAKWTEVEVPDWMARDEQERQRRAAAANLASLPRPLKPPSKRTDDL